MVIWFCTQMYPFLQQLRVDYLGSVTWPFEVSVAISWMAGMSVLPDVLIGW